MGDRYKLVTSNPPTLEHCLSSSKSGIKVKVFLGNEAMETNYEYQKQTTPSMSMTKNWGEAVLILNENPKCLTIPEQSASLDNTTKHK